MTGSRQRTAAGRTGTGSPAGPVPAGSVPAGSVPAGSGPAGANPADPADPARARVAPAWVGPLVRVIGGVVAVWGAAVLAVFGAFLTPLRIGTVFVPVSLVIAVAGPALLMWFAYRVTGRKFMAVITGLVWIAVILPGTARTDEGDLILAEQWVSILYLFLCPIMVAVVSYRLVLPPPAVPVLPQPAPGRRSR